MRRYGPADAVLLRHRPLRSQSVRGLLPAGVSISPVFPESDPSRRSSWSRSGEGGRGHEPHATVPGRMQCPGLHSQCRCRRRSSKKPVSSQQAIICCRGPQKRRMQNPEVKEALKWLAVGGP